MNEYKPERHNLHEYHTTPRDLGRPTSADSLRNGDDRQKGLQEVP